MLGLLDANPVVDQLAQMGQLHRLGHVTVHAGLSGTFAVLAEDMRGERDHWGTRPGIVRFPLAQLVRGLKPSSTGISQSISTGRTAEP